MGNMKKTLAIFCFLFATFSYSQNEDGFEYIGNSDDGTQYFVKIEKVDFNSKDAWLKWIEPTKTIKNKKGKYVKSGGGHTLVAIKFYCEDKVYESTDCYIYDRNGNLKNQLDMSEHRDKYQERVIPGSHMESVFNYVCQ
jgi:hypothetical protein